MKRTTKKKLVVLRESDTAFSASRAMKDHNIGCVLVSEPHGKLTGIVTDRDVVLRVVCSPDDPRDVTLRDIMTPNPVTIAEGEGIDTALSVMQACSIRRLPVVNSEHEPVGIVALDDLLAQRVPRAGRVAELVEKQIERPTRLGTGAHLERGGEDKGLHGGVYSVSADHFYAVREEQRGELSRAHALQTLGRMLTRAQESLARHNVFAVDRDCVRQGLSVFFKCLVRRIDAGAAGNLIPQLPSLMQEELWSAPAGPDSSIDRAVMERCVRMALGVKPDDAESALRGMVETLILSVTEGELGSFTAQLPGELKELFDEEVECLGEVGRAA